MNSQSQLKLALVLSAFFFFGCQQAGQINQSSVTLDKASGDTLQTPPASNEDDGTQSVSDSGSESNGEDDGSFTNSCLGFFNEEVSNDFSDALDINISNHSGQLEIQKGKSVVIQNVSGQLTVHESQALAVSNVSGNSKLRSNIVTSIENVSGSLCVHAGSIMTIKSGSGNARILADSIDELSVQSGNLHIYKAKVRMAHALNGNICLHDGATIENLDTVSGHVKSNCP